MSEVMNSSEIGQSGGSLFENLLIGSVDWWQRQKAQGIKGAENGFGSYEIGYSVEDILANINIAGRLGVPASYVVYGSFDFWQRGMFGEAMTAKLPSPEREKGFDPIVVRDLMTKLGMLPRKDSDSLNRVIFSVSREVEDRSLVGAEVQTIYNILHINSDLVAKNTYWHELIRGRAYEGNVASALITVNKSFVPTNLEPTFFNKLRLRLQGV